MSDPDRARSSSRLPLLVFALALALGLGLFVLVHEHTAHGPAALEAQAERLAPPVAGGGALPVAAPAPAR